MLKLEKINFSYGEKHIIKDLSLTVNDGESICISGVSGSGKSTLLKIIAGLLKVQSGICEMPERVSCVFQEDRLIPHLNNLKNVTLFIPSEKQESAQKLLCEIGLGEFLNKKPEQLSGGMKRRLSIARAILFDGDILLLDEPFNGLDTDNKILMSGIIKREFLNKGKSVISVSHIDEDIKLLGAKRIELDYTR